MTRLLDALVWLLLGVMLGAAVWLLVLALL